MKGLIPAVVSSAFLLSACTGESNGGGGPGPGENDEMARITGTVPRNAYRKLCR